MTDTTITIRTNEELKEQAAALFDSMGLSLSAAINMFLKQAVRKKRFPCSLEAEIAEGYDYTYPAGFFASFGSCRELFSDESHGELLSDGEPLELDFAADSARESLDFFTGTPRKRS